mmetsp:Transcript_12531/g.52708  ORF Transcript_12531/g.52708 Transcript_12531/m.52708 type:complete len:314 (-) Transcript_12531:1213-2154(-)
MRFSSCSARMCGSLAPRYRRSRHSRRSSGARSGGMPSPCSRTATRWSTSTARTRRTMSPRTKLRRRGSRPRSNASRRQPTCRRICGATSTTAAGARASWTILAARPRPCEPRAGRGSRPSSSKSSPTTAGRPSQRGCSAWRRMPRRKPAQRLRWQLILSTGVRTAISRTSATSTGCTCSWRAKCATRSSGPWRAAWRTWRRASKPCRCRSTRREHTGRRCRRRARSSRGRISTPKRRCGASRRSSTNAPLATSWHSWVAASCDWRLCGCGRQASLWREWARREQPRSPAAVVRRSTRRALSQLAPQKPPGWRE